MMPGALKIAARSIVSVSIAVLFPLSSVLSQAVRGTISDAAGVPVPGVVVVLADSLDAVAGRALSDQAGRFIVRAMRAGTYRLRTLRIGFKPDISEPISLRLGEEVSRQVSLTNIPFALDRVVIAGRTACSTSGVANASATRELLEQARAAIAATELTNESREIQATSVVYRQVMDPGGLTMLGRSAAILTDSGAQPWKSTPVDSLRRRGYVIESGDSLVYRAPGLDMLASDAFVADHCFRLVEAPGGGRVGIAFEPSPERKRVSDIRGTLWLDRATAELRQIEFRFVNIETAIMDARAGGEAEFVRMKNGSWAISNWNIRMPVLEFRQRGRVGRTRMSGGTSGDITIDVASQNVAGGNLSIVTRAENWSDTLWSRTPITVTGAVIDSVSGMPVEGARLALRDTPVSATTDASGTFSLSGIFPGNHTLELRTPSLDSVGAVNALAFTVTDKTAPIRIRVPSATHIATALCGAQLKTMPTNMQGIVFGFVGTIGDTVGAVSANVVAEWTEGVDDDLRWKEGKSDETGRFRFCGVPIGKNLVLRAMTDSGSAEPALALIAANRKFVKTELLIDPTEPGTGSLAGLVVRDTANNPIEDAEVVATGTGKSVLTNKRGAFRLREIPAGEYEIVVRKLGYGPMTTKLTFAPNKTVTRRIVLTPVQVLNEVNVVTERMRDPQLKLFEEHRKQGIGYFVTREQLEARPNLPLSTFFGEMPGARVSTQGTRAWVGSMRGCIFNVSVGTKKPDAPKYELDERRNDEPVVINGCCFPSVYLDRAMIYGSRNGEPVPNINRFLTEQVEAIEYFAGMASVPAEYQGPTPTCGVVVIHTRRDLGSSAKRPPSR